MILRATCPGRDSEDIIRRMKTKQRISPEVRAALHRLENPYAWVQIDGFEGDQDETVVASAASPAAESHSVRTAKQGDLFARTALSTTHTASGNPYATLARLGDEDEISTTRSGQAPRPQVASKSLFTREARRIFQQYISPHENAILRQEHRSFIERNQDRPARIRFLLLHYLRKYDLTNLVGLQPQFNREKESLTALKLAEIEKLVDEDA
jgi:hypothetical protein